MSVNNLEVAHLCMIELLGYCSESEAVSGIDDKIEQIIDILTRLNASFSNKTSFREWFCTSNTYIEKILFILQVYVHHEIRSQIIPVILKISVGFAMDKRLCQLVDSGATRVLFQALRAESMDSNSNEDLMINTLKILCRLAPFDRRFALRARLSQCIIVTIQMLRSQMAYMTTIAMQVQTSISKSSVGAKKCSRPGLESHTVASFPHNICNNIRTILEALRCYAGRQGRGNSMVLGRSGLISILIRGIALSAGLPYERHASMSTIHRRLAPEEAVADVSEVNDTASTPLKVAVLPTLDSLGSIGMFSTTSNSIQNTVSGSQVVNMVASTVSAALVRVPTIGLIRPKPYPIACGVNSNSLILKNFLSTLVVLMKYRRNVFRANSVNGIPVLLDLFLDVHRCDLEGRRVDIQLLSLACLQMMTNYRNGRKAVLAAGGLFALFAVCAGYVGPSPHHPCLQSVGEVTSKRRKSVHSHHIIPDSPVSTSTTSLVATVPLMKKMTSDASISATRSPGGNIDYTLTASFIESILLEACLLLRRCCPSHRLPLYPAEPIIRVTLSDDKVDNSSKTAALSTVVEQFSSSNFQLYDHTDMDFNSLFKTTPSPPVNVKSRLSKGVHMHTEAEHIRLKHSRKHRPKTVKVRVRVLPDTAPTNSQQCCSVGCTSLSAVPGMKRKSVLKPTRKKRSAVGQMSASVDDSEEKMHLPRILKQRTFQKKASSESIENVKKKLPNLGKTTIYRKKTLPDKTKLLRVSKKTMPAKQKTTTNGTKLTYSSGSPRILTANNTDDDGGKLIAVTFAQNNLTKKLWSGHCVEKNDENSNDDEKEDEDDDDLIHVDDDDEDENFDDADDNAEDGVSSSGCETPDVPDEIAPKFFREDLISSHGHFFPEWFDIPSIGIQKAYNLSCDPVAVANSSRLFDRMVGQSRFAKTEADRYLVAAREVHSLLDYATKQTEKLVPYPDLIGAVGPPYREPFFSRRTPTNVAENNSSPTIQSRETSPKNTTLGNDAPPGGRIPYRLWGLSHAEILDDVRRLLDSDDLIEKVVFDLDALISHPFPSPSPAPFVANQTSTTVDEALEKLQLSNEVMLVNADEQLSGKLDAEIDHLQFESRFECGNLRKAIQVRQNEYDLILSADVNTNTNIQWFYFRISNIESDMCYRFNIINLEKPGSQYNGGMQPVMLSVKESTLGNPYWVRAGYNIKYYKNHFLRFKFGKGNSRNYYTATFTMRFKHQGDVCYLAYHYPYSHSRLLADLTRWQIRALTCPSNKNNSGVYFRVQKLTSTLLNNSVPVVTITQTGEQTDRSVFKPYIFITARVHPGESNASWVMRGILECLSDPNNSEIERLRQMYVFKIVPSLNPDGVICGNHRCSLYGKDLNRRWVNPSATLNPTIFHTKCLINLLTEVKNIPYMYIDLHGHSRMKDIFVYGCDPRQSWKKMDKINPIFQTNGLVDESFVDIANILYEISPPFSKTASDFSITKVKESTGRVVVWRQFGVIRSYTLEASYCGTTRDCWANNTVRYREPSSTAINAIEISESMATLLGVNSDRSLVAGELGHQLSPLQLEQMGAHLCEAFIRSQSVSHEISLLRRPLSVNTPCLQKTISPDLSFEVDSKTFDTCKLLEYSFDVDYCDEATGDEESYSLDEKDGDYAKQQKYFRLNGNRDDSGNLRIRECLQLVKFLKTK